MPHKEKQMGGTQPDARRGSSAVGAAHSDSKYASLRGEEGLNQVAMRKERRRERAGGWRAEIEMGAAKASELAVRKLVRTTQGRRRTTRCEEKRTSEERERDVSKNRLTRSFSHSRT